ncbi:MalY/PatB family protein [Glaciihabitans sp. dw_435]|uniref:MalY/PatB family protein n=1 Tax=Glaciihabitans sp. dw_435 TaxID=2720081 RepID=UPI001BD35415|nr:aminotransferase class I/II-fold pyridoxal phosphate-dependent enzyme [Glaciihabitans sp. dw_435]
MPEVHADPLALLRARTSEKWVAYPPDVLPLFVAEMDYPLAPPVAAAMIGRISVSDTGYVLNPGPLAPAFASYASRVWGWTVDPGMVRTTTDVSVAIVETLRRVIRPGDGVVITPPVYPPFFEMVGEAGGTLVEVPLTDDGQSYSLDLDGLERAFAAGARALLLCSPHNPLGLVHHFSTLERVAELAARYDVTVVSDEIHAPLLHGGVTFTPFLAVSDAAREQGITVTSASKAWNLAGVKCAIMVAGSDRGRDVLDGMSEEVGFRTSILGLHGSVAAYDEGGPWLDGVLAALESNRDLLRALLADRLPGVVYREPQAGYLAWLDFSALGWGDDPSVVALESARVALMPGPAFGTQGRGFVRLNFACAPEVLTEAIDRLAGVAATHARNPTTVRV